MLLEKVVTGYSIHFQQNALRTKSKNKASLYYFSYYLLEENHTKMMGNTLDIVFITFKIFEKE